MSLMISAAEIECFKETGINAVQEAGAALLHLFGRNRKLAEKANGDWVTQADLLSDRIIQGVLRSSRPKIRLVSEEDSSQGYDLADPIWMIDPLDGTHNFCLGIPVFAISLTLVIDGKPFLSIMNQPLTRHLIVAQRDRGVTLNSQRLSLSPEGSKDQLGTICYVLGYANRREDVANDLLLELRRHSMRVLELWAPSLSWCLVAQEKADSVICLYPSRFDNMGGVLVLEEAGGLVTAIDLDADHAQLSNPLPCILVGSTYRTIHQVVLATIQRCIGQ